MRSKGGLNKQGQLLLEKCKQNPEKYKVVMGNDCITDYEINPYPEDFDEWYNLNTYYISYTI